MADLVTTIGADDREARKALDRLREQISSVAEAAGVQGAGKIAKLGLAFGSAYAVARLGASAARTAVHAVSNAMDRYGELTGVTTGEIRRMKTEQDALNVSLGRFGEATGVASRFASTMAIASEGVNIAARAIDAKAYENAVLAESNAKGALLGGPNQLQREEALLRRINDELTTSLGLRSQEQAAAEAKIAAMEREFQALNRFNFQSSTLAKAEESLGRLSMTLRADANRATQERQAKAAIDSQIQAQDRAMREQEEQRQREEESARIRFELDMEAARARGEVTDQEADEARRRYDIESQIDRLRRAGASVRELEDALARRNEAVSSIAPQSVRAAVTGNVSIAAGLGGNAGLREQVFGFRQGGSIEPLEKQQLDTQKAIASTLGKIETNTRNSRVAVFS